MEYTAFISCSDRQEDKPVVNWFCSILKSNGIRPIIASQYPKPKPPQDKIQEMIEEADAIVVINTRRDKIEGKNSWKGPDWIQNEVGIAFSLSKPIAIFIEKGVDVQGLIPRIGDYVEFERNVLSNCKPKVTRYIKNLREAIEASEEEELGFPCSDCKDYNTDECDNCPCDGCDDASESVCQTCKDYPFEDSKDYL